MDSTRTDWAQQIRKFALDEKVFLEGGKVAALERLIQRCKAEDKRMLLFSQVHISSNRLITVAQADVVCSSRWF